MDGFPTPDPATVFPEGLEPNQEDNEKRSLNKLVGLSQLILTALQGGLSVSWGNITGTLSNQTDLQEELDVRAAENPPRVLVVGEAETISFTNNSLNEHLSLSSSGITTFDLVFPSDANSRENQELSFSFSVPACDGLNISQAGGGLVLSGFGSNTFTTVPDGIIAAVFKKVAANTWDFKMMRGTWS
jgi:hypothetical protein